MRRPLVPALLALMACTGAEPEAPAEAPAEAPSEAPAEAPEAADAPAVPNEAALAFYCAFMWEVHPATRSGRPGDEAQQALAGHMYAQAEEAGVEEFEGFWAHLVDLQPEERQAWVEAGIAAHGLEEECEVALVPGRQLEE